MADKTPPDEEHESRFTRRYKTGSTGAAIRESDKMRTEIPLTLHNVSVGGLGFCLEPELRVGEDIKIKLINEIQRFEKEVRGKVRRVSTTSEGTYFCGVELYTRLTPLDITLIRTNIFAHPEHDGPLWV